MWKEKGMTLVELLLALGLMGVVLAGLMSAFWFTLFAFERGIDQTDSQYAARQGRERIIRDFRSSEGFSVQDTAGNNMAMGSTGQRLHLVREGEEIDFYAHNNQLYRDSTISSPEPVAADITSIKFISPVPGLLILTITARAGSEEWTAKTAYMSRVSYTREVLP
ncbi:MAG: prepilin-type N-terminal cleavage/methylation domain-containing protein [Syntrophomonadaceae bacterium]|jgi:prepilin-type N-terminal cleavage/methylation domain-containing protein